MMPPRLGRVLAGEERRSPLPPDRRPPAYGRKTLLCETPGRPVPSDPTSRQSAIYSGAIS
jgi:hypothetical protein